MYRESAGKLFVKYAIPQMTGLLFNSVYVIVDGVFIGVRLGSPAMAAAGVAVPKTRFCLREFLAQPHLLPACPCLIF